MSQVEFEFKVTPPDRDISEFAASQLLYEYIQGTLSPNRKTQIERALKDYPQLQTEAESLRKALSYCEQLKGISPSPRLEEILAKGRPSITEKIKNNLVLGWSPHVRWTLQAFAISAAVAAVGVWIPWQDWAKWASKKGPSYVVIKETKTKLPSSDEGHALLLSGQARDEEETPLGDTPSQVAETQQTAKEKEPSAPVKGDKPSPLTGAGDVTPAASPSASSSPSSAATSAATSGATSVSVAPTPTPPPTPPSKVPLSPPPVPVAEKTVAPEDSEAKNEERPSSKLKGYVYRGFMNIVDVEAKSSEIRRKIEELGGAKAGDVELGWKRQTGRYYHFVLPESSYESLAAYLQTLGPVRIYKDRHRKVMPEGELRFILWVSPIRKSPSPQDGQ